MCIILNVTCNIGKQDGKENHRGKKGGDHNVQRIPAARGHLKVENVGYEKENTNEKEAKGLLYRKGDILR